jgi:hypothetical protein
VPNELEEIREDLSEDAEMLEKAQKDITENLRQISLLWKQIEMLRNRQEGR